jgi:hypothetical protein
VLQRAASPAAAEHAALYATPRAFNIDPAIALAFFHHESTYGTAGIAKATHNWGNLRHGQGRAQGAYHGFATYATWVDSLQDWCSLISASYIRARRLISVRAVLPIYAPSSDGNSPTRYADRVIADVARWQTEDRAAAPRSGETHYRVRSNVTSGATIRAAPRKNAAVLGRLHAGDTFWGFAIPGQLVTVAGFGSSATWVRDSTMRCVSAVLLEEVQEQ